MHGAGKYALADVGADFHYHGIRDLARVCICTLLTGLLSAAVYTFFWDNFLHLIDSL